MNAVMEEPKVKAAEKCQKTKHKFMVQAEPDSKVYLAGCFNQWNERDIQLKHKGDGMFEVEMSLAPGMYEYKFLIDDEWSIDPVNPNFTSNGMGTLNSVVEII